jgi:hypothetical protein
VSSITDNGTGDYTVNFTTAMPDANYNMVGSTGDTAAGAGVSFMLPYGASPTVNGFSLLTFNSATTADAVVVSISVFR